MFLRLEHPAFFFLWFIEESTDLDLDLKLKEMSVSICNPAAHLFLISHSEIPEGISRIP